MRQVKFELDNEGREEAIAYAKWKTKITKKQHYVIGSGAVDGMGYYVEDESPFIRTAFESQIYPVE